jgi:Leucine-rich repeat (LRR) protein
MPGPPPASREPASKFDARTLALFNRLAESNRRSPAVPAASGLQQSTRRTPPLIGAAPLAAALQINRPASSTGVRGERPTLVTRPPPSASVGSPRAAAGNGVVARLHAPAAAPAASQHLQPSSVNGGGGGSGGDGTTSAPAAGGAAAAAPGAASSEAPSAASGVGAPVVLRTAAERMASPERLNLDRRGLEACPLLQGEERLRLLNYQNNSIKVISNLHTLPYLIFLDLYNNQLTHISGLEQVPSLRVLMLGKNLVSKVERLDCLSKLDVLDLHCNRA